MRFTLLLILSLVLFRSVGNPSVLAAQLPDPVIISSGWKIQDSAKVSVDGSEISSARFVAEGWHDATVPGTVLTSLVDDGIYAEPLYGQNNRPDKIPEDLCRTRYWYRTRFEVPKNYAGRSVWLNLDGINYSADIWVNGKSIGTITGAFARGVFNISSIVEPGEIAALAVLISPQPHPGVPHEHTLASGMGPNGGISAIDGPTFLCAMGWDWIPAIRDRDAGIWQKVFLSATGPVTIKDPLVTSDVPLPDLNSADVAVQVTVQNISNEPQKGILKGSLGEVEFTQTIAIGENSSKLVSLNSSNCPMLHIKSPKLWWPNGYGAQNLNTLHLEFETRGVISDVREVTFGIRKVTYSVPDSKNLTISVNGVPVFCKGGDWGMDEAMKRIPRSRLEAQIRMHQIANLNMIRNWVGQSTSEDFYELCDKYGILLWDEFFQPNPGDGPNPTNLEAYVHNVREKILRFRNHPSIALWCGRNEGFPPEEIDKELRELMRRLDPTRLYQPSSTSGRGVNSGGPYSAGHLPKEYYEFGEAFKTEIGSVSIPTLESIHGMMPEEDWETINDDWAEHDLAGGASGGVQIRQVVEKRYGAIANLADFVRKSQLLNYETFRAIYEGRNAKMFHPSTGVIIWMSNPAQPSFVWQIYHHDLEPNASLFAVKEACEPLHIQLNESNGHLMVINNHPEAIKNAKARVAIYNLDGSLISTQTIGVRAEPSAATDLGRLILPENRSSVYFAEIKLSDSAGKMVSRNFYWQALQEQQENLQDLSKLPVVLLDASVSRRHVDGKCLLNVTLHNPTAHIALMAHLQLRHQSGARVLPAYYSDNYISLASNESEDITIEAAEADLSGEKPMIVLDGWNVGVSPADASTEVAVAVNEDSQVMRWPVSGLPIAPSTNVYHSPPSDRYKISCGGMGTGEFDGDENFSGGHSGSRNNSIDVSAPMAGPAALYQSERWGDCVYQFSMKQHGPYNVRLHFAETTFDDIGRRRFNVEINGKRVLWDFDVFREAGRKNKAVVKKFPDITPDKDGNIRIRFQRGSIELPEINGIEISESRPSITANAN